MLGIQVSTEARQGWVYWNIYEESSFARQFWENGKEIQMPTADLDTKGEDGQEYQPLELSPVQSPLTLEDTVMVYETCFILVMLKWSNFTPIEQLILFEKGHQEGLRLDAVQVAISARHRGF